MQLHPLADASHDVSDVIPCSSTSYGVPPRLRIADVVEVDAVNVVAAGNLLADVGQIVGRHGRFRGHVALLTNALDERRIATSQLLAAVSVPLADGQRDDPCVELHATAVALVDGKL